ncbi:recombinase XerC [Streptococcus pluranimalium]
MLRRQFYDRKQHSRNETKLENGRKAVYNTISSKESLRKHESQWRQFAQYAENKHGIKTLKKLDETVVHKYLKDLQRQDIAEKTLKSRVTAINHVMVGSGVWKDNQKISLQQLRSQGLIHAKKGAKNVYKDETSSEWRKSHREAYMRSRDLVDFTRAFGLRRSEIFGKSGAQYQGVTYRNLGHMEGSKRLFAEVVGKGGKYRIVPVRADMAQEMWDKYGEKSREYRTEYFQKDISERERMLKASSDKRERIFKQNKQNVPMHIHRNDYVRNRLYEVQAKYEKKAGKLTQEKIKNRSTGYSRISFKRNGKQFSIFKINYAGGQKFVQQVAPFSIVKIADWEGYAISACEVMSDVGHNRLDVLLKYMT